MIATLDTTSETFDAMLTALLSFDESGAAEVSAAVADIIRQVKTEGDNAVLALTNRFDGQSARAFTELEIGQDAMQAAYESLDGTVRDALKASAERVRTYHERQLEALGGTARWQYVDELGNELGQVTQAMARVGIYAPGGKAAYPSTIIMTAVPASVAGVDEIILCVPTPDGELNKTLLAAAHLCQVDRVFAIGGAQAIAAMAYGTQTVPRVDKIVGPGNIYVATAKEMVFGDVGIDMIAGPSEVVIVADDTADADWVVQDMFAQAEHDEMAQAILVSPSAALLARVEQRLPEMLKAQKRQAIIAKAISDRGALIKVRDLDDAFSVVNRIAPEHLQIALPEAEQYVARVRHAGAVFLGAATAEVVGDYTAGPSHVLPTSGTARFASPLGVYDFQTRTSVIQCSREGAIVLNRAAAIIADEEGLDAHAESARVRVRG